MLFLDAVTHTLFTVDVLFLCRLSKKHQRTANLQETAHPQRNSLSTEEPTEKHLIHRERAYLQRNSSSTEEQHIYRERAHLQRNLQRYSSSYSAFLKWILVKSCFVVNHCSCFWFEIDQRVNHPVVFNTILYISKKSRPNQKQEINTSDAKYAEEQSQTLQYRNNFMFSRWMKAQCACDEY